MRCPTAPEIFPTAICRAACPKAIEVAAILGKPIGDFQANVIGSACTPCVRPICGVC